MTYKGCGIALALGVVELETSIVALGVLGKTGGVLLLSDFRFLEQVGVTGTFNGEACTDGTALLFN